MCMYPPGSAPADKSVYDPEFKCWTQGCRSKRHDGGRCAACGKHGKDEVSDEEPEGRSSKRLKVLPVSSSSSSSSSSFSSSLSSSSSSALGDSFAVQRAAAATKYHGFFAEFITTVAWPCKSCHILNAPSRRDCGKCGSSSFVVAQVNLPTSKNPGLT
jgi:hypothetical protein